MATIKHKSTNKTICEDKDLSIRELAIIKYADLSGANLRDAKLSYADLRDAKLSGAKLSDANLSDAKLSYADLRDADLSDANLSDAKLSGANLSYADLRDADLSGANLSYAKLSGADLSGANLRGADLSGADLRYANLIYADLSGAKGLKTAADFLSQFESDNEGILVYKRISLEGLTEYTPPEKWTVKAGAIITENVNPTKTQSCGCGVNFGTREWCENHYENADLWLCRIRWIDIADVIVPFNSDGKARCAKLELIKKVEK